MLSLVPKDYFKQQCAENISVIEVHLYHDTAEFLTLESVHQFPMTTHLVSARQITVLNELMITIFNSN